MHTTALVVRYAGGGYEQTEEILISSNLNSQELQEAFQKGEELIGIRFRDQFSEYEANKIPLEMVQKMSKFFDVGFDLEDVVPEDWDEYIYVNDYVNLWLNIAKVGNPEFVYELCESGPKIEIGGYGLFH